MVKEMRKGHVFISHSSKNKEFAKIVIEKLRSPDLSPWIDHEQIFAGDDILDKIGEGLATMDVLIFLVSKEALESSWVDLKLKNALFREMKEKRALILPFRLSGVSEEDLPWFLKGRYSPSVTVDSNGASLIADSTKNALELRLKQNGTTPIEESEFKKNEQIENLLKDIIIGDWAASQKSALAMNALTKEDGHNELFEPLLCYLQSPDEDKRWRAIQTIECFSELAPWLFSSDLLFKFGNSRDFSIRSMAAVLCYNLALFAPHMVPINLLVKLSRHNEDWYVCTPAIGALKTLARWRPTILRVFLARLTSPNSYSRELAASAIHDISKKEPEVLDAQELKKASAQLSKIGDKTALDLINEAITNVSSAHFGRHYKYSSF
jgi:hypothetical protein